MSHHRGPTAWSCQIEGNKKSCCYTNIYYLHLLALLFVINSIVSEFSLSFIWFHLWVYQDYRPSQRVHVNDPAVRKIALKSTTECKRKRRMLSQLNLAGLTQISTFPNFCYLLNFCFFSPSLNGLHRTTTLTASEDLLCS